MPLNVLILAGTPEARATAEALTAFESISTITSFAGLTKRVQEPPGQRRMGGFGGRDGFRDYVQSTHIQAVINAVHPFAAKMSDTAYRVCQELRIPYLRLRRPPWQPAPGDDWQLVSSLDEAIGKLPTGASVLVTTGRDWQPCQARFDVAFTIRLMGHPPSSAPPNMTFIPFPSAPSLADERILFQQAQFTHLIAKNAGGKAGLAKLQAAREGACQSILIRRPPDPAPVVAETPTEAAQWLLTKSGLLTN